MNFQDFYEALWDIRGIPVDSVCGDCTGTGVKAYASTATWRGGVGGQAITGGVCDRCWGTGDADKPGVNLRRLSGLPQETRDYLYNNIANR